VALIQCRCSVQRQCVEIMMGEEPRSIEDRRRKRYRYPADATLRQLETGLTLPGVILDLSARG
jgi:hypothetical protein